MNLLNRYLQEVAPYLPKARRDDIVAELRANLLSQMEDREEELGRPMAEAELIEMLQHHGNPIMVAGRYREDNRGLAFGRQLIGPELFPFYRMILLLNLSITTLILGVLMPIFARAIGVSITLSRILTPLIAQFFAVTLIFIFLDWGKDHVLNKWDPGKLPPLKTNPEDGPHARNIFGLICLAVGTLWLVLTPQWPYLMLGPGALYLPALGLKLMPEWIRFYWAISVLLCCQVVLEFFILFRWLPRRNARIMDLVLKIIGVGLGALLLLKAPNYVTSQYPEVARWANLDFTICAIVAVAINSWQTGRLWLSLIRERHQMLPARQY